MTGESIVIYSAHFSYFLGTPNQQLQGMDATIGTVTLFVGPVGSQPPQPLRHSVAPWPSGC